MGAQAQNVGATVDPAYAPDQVLVCAPEVERAAAVLGGERVLGLAHVEEQLALFEQHCVRVLAEEGFEGGGDLFRCLLGRCDGFGRVHGPSTSSLPCGDG